ncbi:MAG: SDR family oxidoreductase [Bacteroidales bacterium]|jgi:NAD(P)-dependent dehydrogenase (short-subunit alcohol dehydrogenase family)
MKDLNLNEKVAVITGGAGVLCSQMARRLAANGVRTAILDRNENAARALASEIEKVTAIRSVGIYADVLDRNSLENAKKEVNRILGSIDILINGAGGNSPEATTGIEMMNGTEDEDLSETFFGLRPEGFDKVFDLNFKGTLLPTMVFCADMINKNSGSIVNVSSMNSFRPLTKVPAYSAAKASINNFTQWLAVHFAPAGVRVNAIAPGFIVTNQNRFLVTDEKTGKFTERGNKIISNTPMGRFGTPEEMSGTVLFLVSDLARFVTGVVIPVDGGFNAYSGV